MKKIFLMCFVAVAVSSFAQENKLIKTGNFLLNGDLSGGFYFYNHNIYDSFGAKISTSEQNLLMITVSADAGYFLFDGFETGFTVGFSYSNSTYPGLPSSNNYDELSMSVGPQVGYYWDMGSLLALFAKAKACYRFSQTTYVSGTQFIRHVFLVYTKLGTAFFLADNAALELGPYFQWDITMNMPANMTDVRFYVGVSVGATLFF